ncbi:MAG TPA: hypothetical protein DHW02_24185 [Ktedonobacter sp.]|nr:hypothetical protein [Ktedonobacter sp.]
MSLPARQPVSWAASDATGAADATNMTSSVESTLVQMAQAGDETALGQLFERYNARIHLYLARMVGDDEVGRELTQETFLKAWESLARLRDPSRFTSWLYRIATNIAYDHLRRPRTLWLFPSIHHEEHAQVQNDMRSDMMHLERRVEERELLTLALQRVSLTYRACVILQIVEELPQRQIATLLGIKEGSVSKYVSRGLHELRNAYLQLTSEQQVDGKE